MMNNGELLIEQNYIGNMLFRNGSVCPYHPRALGSNPKHNIYAFPIYILIVV